MTKKVMKKVIIKRNEIITAYNFFHSDKVFIHVPAYLVTAYGILRLIPDVYWMGLSSGLHLVINSAEIY